MVTPNPYWATYSSSLTPGFVASAFMASRTVIASTGRYSNPASAMQLAMAASAASMWPLSSASSSPNSSLPWGAASDPVLVPEVDGSELPQAASSAAASASEAGSLSIGVLRVVGVMGTCMRAYR